jgi:D-glycero-D-manno-heptose 1,7-bisphosphate phosphatase
MTAEDEPSFIDPSRRMRRLLKPPHVVRPAMFLDRDGTMIEDRKYLANPAGVALIEGCGALLIKARERGFALVVVTNQSGIGRGYFGWREYERLENRLIDLLAREGAELDAVLANAAVPSDTAHDWRKPQPGMLIAASKALNLSLERSVIIGDKASDLEAGRAAGLRLGIHVSTGHGISERDAAQRLATSRFHVELSASIAAVMAMFDVAPR